MVEGTSTENQYLDGQTVWKVGLREVPSFERESEPNETICTRLRGEFQFYKIVYNYFSKTNVISKPTDNLRIWSLVRLSTLFSEMRIEVGASLSDVSVIPPHSEPQ